MTAPVALFAYCRPDHMMRTVESLSRNLLAIETDLIIYSDSARTPEVEQAVKDVRAYLPTIAGFRSVTVKNRPENYGLARSITCGVTEVLEQSDRIIVLEDDMVTSPYFLTYMNEALGRYAGDERVASIHGYVYPVDQVLPESFFLPGADCWGWATWRRGWAHFNPNGQYLLDELKRRNMIRSFDFNGAHPFSQMLEGQIKGKNDSWAVRWYASTFLADKLTLYPGRSLVHNIGNDDSGTHCGNSSSLDVELSRTLINLKDIAVEVSRDSRYAIEVFLRKQHMSLPQRLARGIGASLRAFRK